MTEAGRILLVGDSAVGKHQLLAAIGASPASEQSGSAAAVAADALLRLDTKYYTADAHVELRHIDQCASLQLSDGAYETVLLVFDASRQPSFEAVQAWFEGAGGAAADLPIRLAVATGLHRLTRRSDGHVDKPLWLAEAEEWCAEQLMEFVEVGEEAAREETAEAARGGEGASGAARVREALEAHMWPGMRLKAAPRHGAAAIAAAAAAEADEAEAAAAAALRQRQQQQDRQQGQGAAQANSAATVPAANGAPADGQAAAAAADEEEFSFARYLQAPQAAAGGPGSGAAGAGAGAAPAGGEEAEVEQLERLFAQVAGHRERLAALPDAQRREQAAALVMQLMAAMGLEEEGEEEGDEA
ncbi:hypothetical protein COHA_002304 [Chlorella ohadii]|uniref:Uncharacterized protein n=1 Tax=Chlorella ohadii TaxID=2649997 RepID=A0AAD5E0X7_9CHLO|nr:hypothetical protein COHA_002304 [Chlorella ohadii]